MLSEVQGKIIYGCVQCHVCSTPRFKCAVNKRQGQQCVRCPITHPILIQWFTAVHSGPAGSRKGNVTVPLSSFSSLSLLCLTFSRTSLSNPSSLMCRQIMQMNLKIYHDYSISRDYQFRNNNYRAS